jgi:hypothetical protein
MTKRHVIQILYTERCRFLPLALSRVRHALALRFRSSPTVRVDERDVVPSVDAIGRALDEVAAACPSRAAHAVCAGRVKYTVVPTPTVL